MGTSHFAIPALKELISRRFDVLGVVTQPDRPSGRGKKLKPSPIKEFSIKNNLKVYQPEKVREQSFVKTLLELSPDVMVVAAFGQLLPQKVLDIPPCGAINLHPSLLPKYRGAAPIQWALINGERETGITLMLLDAGEDTGDIICNESIAIGLGDTAETLQNTLADTGARLLVEVLAQLSNGELPVAKAQIHADATHAPRLTKKIGKIDWKESAITIHNLIRGTAGWPGAYSYFREETLLKIIHALPYEESLTVKKNILCEQPGTIWITSERKLLAVTGSGVLELLRVQPATKKIMAVNDFINGYQIKNGEMFSFHT